MGPLAVVDPKPRVREGAQLRDGFKEVGVQHLGSIAPIEALRCTRSGPACLAGCSAWRPGAPRTSRQRGCAVNSGPLSTRTADGRPCRATSSLRTRTTRRLGSDMPIAISSPSRLPSSMIVSSRTRRPSSSVSVIKSSAQVWFSTGGAVSGCRIRRGTRRVVRRDTFRPQGAVDPMHALVVPRPAIGPESITQCPEAPARVAGNRIGQPGDHRRISPARRQRRLVVRRTREPHHATGPLNRELVLAHQYLSDLPLRGRPYSFGSGHP